MTAPSTIRSGVGLRNWQIMALDANGYPAASGTSAYEGVQISGARTLGLTDPEPRVIHHVGDDAVFNIDVIPPLEAMRGELVVSKINDVVDAILTGQESFAVGDDFQMFGEATNQRGFENQVAAVVYQQAQDENPASASFGSRLWEFKIFPKVILFPRSGGMDDNPTAKPYTVVPQFVSKHLWGVSFADATEGFTRGQCVRGVGRYKPKIAAFKGDNTTTEFTFPADTPAANASGIKVWVDGVEQTSGVTKATDGVTFTTAPTTNAMIVTLRGLA